MPNGRIVIEKFESTVLKGNPLGDPHVREIPVHLPAGNEDLLTLNVIAMSACYSPNPEREPHLFDLPFDHKTGELIEDVWERWLDWDPVRLIGCHEAALRKLKLFFDCGTKDEFRLYAGARIFSEKLNKNGDRACL